MKKFNLLFLAMMVIVSYGSLFAQNSVLKEAKKSLGSKNYQDAKTLLKQAADNPETANNPETWKLMGDIGDKIFSEEYAKAALAQQADEKKMYDALYECYLPYLKADSLAQLPDDKGKIKNKYRKDIASILRANYPFFINSGVFYNNQQNYTKASDCFQIYWDIPQLDMFEGQNVFVLDSTYQIIKYYAIITAIQAQEHPRAINMLKRAGKEPFIENSVYEESDMYELLASEYYNTGDTVNYVQTLQVGTEKFPKDNYFLLNLINEFIRTNQRDQAKIFIDKALANDPENACDLHSVKGTILTEEEDYATAEAEYNKALEKDANCERALEAIGVNYIIQAQNLKEATTALGDTDRAKVMENDKKTLELYNQAMPYLERYTKLLKERKADSTEINQALMKLRNVYYNLSNLGEDKSKELNAIEAELNIEEDENNQN